MIVITHISLQGKGIKYVSMQICVSQRCFLPNNCFDIKSVYLHIQMCIHISQIYAYTEMYCNEMYTFIWVFSYQVCVFSQLKC